VKPLIVHVTNAGGYGRVQRGGAERGVMDLIRNRDTLKYDVLLVCPPDMIGWLDTPDVETVAMCPEHAIDLQFLWQLTSLLKARRPSIVHGHLLSGAGHARVAARAAGVPIVISDLHNSLTALLRVDGGRHWWLRPRYGLYAAAERILANHLTHVNIAISASVAEDMTRLGISPSSIRVIPNWVDTELFRPLGAELRDRVHEQRFGDAIGIVAAGRLESTKGFDLLLATCALLKPGWRLVLLGDGERRHALAAQASALGIAGNVEMPGFQSDIASWFASADVVAVPSLVEGFGRSAVEALATGTPVVASAADGLVGVLGGLPGATLVSGREPAAWRAAMVSALQTGASRESISEEVGRRYSLSTAVSRYERLYDCLLAAAPGKRQ
jgi:glycosyltransferase involved in cell wall biosynthesis